MDVEAPAVVETKQAQLPEITTPVLIFAAGLGRYAANTADGVADVVAETMDRLTPDQTFGTKSDPKVAAPRGLRAAKTIVNGSDIAVLQLFELDYMTALEPASTVAGPPVVPGLVRSASYAVMAGLKWLAALHRPAKSARAKSQLFVGLLAAGALLFAALTALYSLLVAAGVNFPGGGIFGEEAAKWVFGITSLGLVITWSSLRKKILALSATSERLIRFVLNEDAVADSTSLILADAIDGLRDANWTGDVHLLGYSFGSLVLYEAVFPRKTSLSVASSGKSVSSLVTIGCPLDIVRLYQPDFSMERVERCPQAAWTNIFNEADIFASNMRDDGDTSAGPGDAVTIGGTTPNSIRYLDEKLSWFRLLTSGRAHARYWGAPDRASCFEPLVALWHPTAG